MTADTPARSATWAGGPLRLNVGCGVAPLAGWLNIDIEPLVGVDRVLDVRDGLPFEGVATILAEHFLEHLELEDAIAFLRECRRVLAADGVLRLSTPNLDWVWLHQYDPARQRTAAAGARDCFWINKAFHGWGHRFLWNRWTLEAVLRSVGFAELAEARPGESTREELRGVERHEVYPEGLEVPHVIVAEAWGLGPVDESGLAELRREYDHAVNYSRHCDEYKKE